MFAIDNKTGLIIPNPNKLIIPEFKKIWERDKSKSKSTALAELSYVYFICDFKSPYLNSYIGEELKSTVKGAFITSKTWKEDKVIKEAIAKYNRLQETKTIKLFRASEKALDELTAYFDTISLKDETVNGVVVVDPKKHDKAAKLMSNLQKVAATAASIEEARKKVEKDVSLKDNKLRGKGTIKSREMPKSRR